jgi:hypothetical protein
MEIYVIGYLGLLFAAFIDSIAPSIALATVSVLLIAVDAYMSKDRSWHRVFVAASWVVWRVLSTIPSVYEDHGMADALILAFGAGFLFGLFPSLPSAPGLIVRSFVIGFMVLPVHHAPDRVYRILVTVLFCTFHMLTLTKVVDVFSSMWILYTARAPSNMVWALILCIMYVGHMYRGYLFKREVNPPRDVENPPMNGKAFELLD